MSESPMRLRETTRSPLAPQWLVRLCRPSRMLWLAPLLAFLLTLPSVLSGYVQDDHVLRQDSLDTPISAKRPAWDRYTHGRKDTPGDDAQGVVRIVIHFAGHEA